MGKEGILVVASLDMYNDSRRKEDRFSISNLPSVSNPQDTFANITRGDYEDYLKNFRSFEEQLIGMTNDTSLIDQAREDAPQQAKISADIQRRNAERYGGAGLSNAQKQEQQRANQRGGALNLAGNVNNARIEQRSVNDALLKELISVGQGVNQNALSGLGDASAMSAQRQAAYKNAKSQHHSNMVGLGGAVIGAIFGI